MRWSILAIDPHPLALAKKDLADAQEAADQANARAFLDSTGSVEERKQRPSSTQKTLKRVRSSAKKPSKLTGTKSGGKRRKV
jgi:hypothetical protein